MVVTVDVWTWWGLADSKASVLEQFNWNVLTQIGWGISAGPDVNLGVVYKTIKINKKTNDLA